MRIKEEDLLEIFKTYLIWVSEGRKPYFGNSIEKNAQYYYDNWKENIEHLTENFYTFNIQVDGGIECDEWEKGTFEVKDGKVNIISHASYLN